MVRALVGGLSAAIASVAVPFCKVDPSGDVETRCGPRAYDRLSAVVERRAQAAGFGTTSRPDRGFVT